MKNRIKAYLARPEAGAGLLYAALVFGVIRLWITAWISQEEGAYALFPDAPPMFVAWTLASLALGGVLAFILLRRRLSQRTLQRVLLIATVHAVGAVRFYDWGLMLLSVLPLFALLPAVLLPSVRPRA